MALDLTETALQIDHMADAIKHRSSDKRRRLADAISATQGFDPAAYDARRNQPGAALNWTLPEVWERPIHAVSPPALPDEYAVVGVDGSHIDVSRHIPARCFLINIGGMTLRYGASAAAAAFSEPRLYAHDDELVIRDEHAPYREETISGAVLDAKRAVEELRGLASAIQDAPADIPTLGLLDGSMVLFGMHRHPDFVVRRLVDEGFVEVLDDLRRMAVERTLAIASYISLPRSAELVNALRLSHCPYSVPNCERECGKKPVAHRPCEAAVGGVMDRDVFAETLRPSERSPVFGSNANIVRTHYGDHQIRFFYIRIEEEIGRVEVPHWVADDETLLGLTHALIVEQCNLGPGYPVSLKEAHEQAVVSGADRRRFVELVEDALVDRRLPVYSSEKNISKMRRWL